ncbi:MAG: DUF2917 domain-containing protein [Comamonadaceae bacterium]|nr:MAG: DUF2917 domain-containing protein [Comamonadaceae bacterium]
MEHAALSTSDHTLQQASEAVTGFVNTLPGCWKLAAGRALTVRAAQAGMLRIAHGRVWATFDLAEGDSRVRAGDHFLSRGESLELQAGQSLVIESYGSGQPTSAYFSWEPAAARALAFQPAAAGWRAEVLQPLSDLRTAGSLATAAMARLASGLIRSSAASVGTLLTPLATDFVARRSMADESNAGQDSGEVRDFYYAERARKAAAFERAESQPSITSAGSLQRLAV